MTDKHAEPPRTAGGSGVPQTFDQLVHTCDWYGAPDTTLARLADFADAAKAGIGITLIVPSGLICGTIESTQEFFTETSLRFRATVQTTTDTENHTANEVARVFFDETGRIVDEEVRRNRDEFEKDPTTPLRFEMLRYIHLSDARFIVPGQEPMLLGHTRVLLSQVIG